MEIYVVKPQDTIYRIAQRYGVSPARLAYDNQTAGQEYLVPGQALLILYPEIIHTVRAGETTGTIASMYQISEKQLEKLEDVLDIKKLEPGSSVTRELIMVKILAKDTQRQPIMNVTEIFHGKIVDVTHDSMVIELVGHQDKLDAFLDLLDGYEILELARTGITGLTRGSDDVKFLD